MGGAERLREESLTVLEQRLGGFGSVRVHRAELVPRDAVRALRTLAVWRDDAAMIAFVTRSTHNAATSRVTEVAA